MGAVCFLHGMPKRFLSQRRGEELQSWLRMVQRNGVKAECPRWA